LIKGGEKGLKEVPVTSGAKAEPSAGADTGPKMAETPAGETIDGARVIDDSPTADGHRVKVTEEGKCLVCSNCQYLEIEYKTELADPKNSSLKGELDEINKLPTDTPADKEAIAARLKNLANDLSDSRTGPAAPGTTPAGPRGNIPEPIPSDVVPAEPVRNLKPGDLEFAARSKLTTPELQKGFDIWVDEMRARGVDPEGPLGKMDPEQVAQASKANLDTYNEMVKQGTHAENVRKVAGSDPLNPDLPHVEKRGDVTIKYDSKPPGAHEIQHGQLIAEKTGHPVELYGNLPGAGDYPGIDGVMEIGTERRPISLKQSSASAADAGEARYLADTAREAASIHGYSKVEVHVWMKNATVDQIKAAWDKPLARTPGTPPADVFQGGTVSRVVIEDANGNLWIVEPGATGPAPVGAATVPPAAPAVGH
jgi:hypothetical protein